MNEGRREGRRKGMGIWIQILALPLTDCVILENSIPLNHFFVNNKMTTMIIIIVTTQGGETTK